MFFLCDIYNIKGMQLMLHFKMSILQKKKKIRMLPRKDRDGKAEIILDVV